MNPRYESRSHHNREMHNLEVCRMAHPNHESKHNITRREFLGMMGMTAASLALAGCQEAPTTVATSAQAINSAGATGSPTVAIAQATSYEPAELRQKVRSLIDALGGFKDVIHTGDKVAIKPNLTGGVSVTPLAGVSAIESYITHPEVVRALGEAVLDAGAKQLYIVESVYEDASWTQWGYQDVAKALGATLVDLNSTFPYNAYVMMPVGANPYIYDQFILNGTLKDVNLFMSVPKMKTHNTAGITLSMKNLFGIAAARNYRLIDQDNIRTAFHGAGNEGPTRVPHVIVDLNRARPVNFALIDGIKTAEGGEGPWIPTMRAKTANVLIAGLNPVATDTVAAAVMGFDATASSSQAPFNGAANHIALAAEKGLGTNMLADIKVVGAAIKDVMTQFMPGR
jgi:uncharacterized protein (DUF362 family)